MRAAAAKPNRPVQADTETMAPALPLGVVLLVGDGTELVVPPMGVPEGSSLPVPSALGAVVGSRVWGALAASFLKASRDLEELAAVLERS